MKKIFDFIKKHYVVTGIVVVTLVATTIYLTTNNNKGNSISVVSTTTLERQTLNQTVTANGIVESTTVYEVNGSGLTSSLSTVDKVNVKVGDYVKEGDILGTFDTSDTDKSISDTKTNLENAKKTKQTNIDNAQKALDDANFTKETHRKANQDKVDSAQIAFSPFELQYEQYEIDYLTKQAIFETVSNDGVSTPEQIQEAKDNAAAAKAVLETFAASQEYTNAKKELDDAKSELQRELDADQISVNSAQRSLDSAKNNNTTIDLYQSQLDSYYETKADAKIKAPISGVVTEVNAKPGSSQSISLTGTSALFIIQDLNDLQVPVNISEYDVVNLKVGMKANILSDAFMGEEWFGEIISISPVAIDTNKNFEVTVKITSDINRLTAGMSAKMNIIIESKENTFAVPYDAVIKNDAGQDIVYVLDSTIETNEKYLTDNWISIVVTTGMETDYYLEISSSELKEGMEVVNDPNFRNSSNRFIDRITE